MSEHPHIWLQAYHDGQLSERRQAQVKAHLIGCPECQAELTELRSLSNLLHTDPPATGLIPTETFIAQVNLRLPRKDAPQTWKRVLRRGWEAAPFGLLASLAFVQAVFIVAAVIMVGVQLTPGGNGLGILSAGPASASAWNVLALPAYNPLQLLQLLLDTVSKGGPLGWAFTIDLGLSAMIGLLYLSWLASWWVQTYQPNRQNSAGRPAKA
jgi:hypothetical protein